MFKIVLLEVSLYFAYDVTPFSFPSSPLSLSLSLSSVFLPLHSPPHRLGGENLAVAQNTYAVLWFKGKELNMVFGLLLSVSRLVSTATTPLLNSLL